MADPKERSFFTYFDEKLLLFFLTTGMVLAVLLFALFNSNTVPVSKEIIPKLCNYNRERFFTVMQSNRSGSSILSKTNQSLTVNFPAYASISKAIWVRHNREIWVMDFNVQIYVLQSITLDVVNLISLKNSIVMGLMNSFTISRPGQIPLPENYLVKSGPPVRV